MTSCDLLDLVLNDIMNGRLDEAEAGLATYDAHSTTELRKKAHWAGLIRFYRGDVRGARVILEQATEEHGPNIALTRDLLVCYYHLNDMPAFRAGLQAFELTLIEHESHLKHETLLECELMLAKFMEEEARLAPAFIFYERALSRAQTPLQRFRVLIQKARWLAVYEPVQALSTYYRELISYPNQQVTRDQWVELQHALMVIELRLIGSDHAWQRIARLMPDVLTIDRRLLVFDYVEGALLLEQRLRPEIYKLIDSFEDLTPYERFLKLLLQGPLASPQKLEELTLLASQLSWSCYLRLLCLAANLETENKTRAELNRKIQLIILGLDPRSQALWNQLLKQALKAPEIKLELSLRSRSVTVHGKTVDLSKKKIGLQLLAGLQDKESLTVDQAIALLWQSSFSPEHYHRLRMSTHRLNTLIHEVTGLGKVIEVDSQTVRLRPEVKLRCADAPRDSNFLSL